MSNELLASDVYAEKELVEDKNVVYPDCKCNRPTLSIKKKKKSDIQTPAPFMSNNLVEFDRLRSTFHVEGSEEHCLKNVMSYSLLFSKAKRNNIQTSALSVSVFQLNQIWTYHSSARSRCSLPGELG
jgi:hypothetical protein